MSKTHEAATNGDSVQIKLGGDFIRKTLPYLLGASVAGGAYAVKSGYDARFTAIEQSQSRLEGKVDLLIDLNKSRRGR